VERGATLAIDLKPGLPFMTAPIYSTTFLIIAFKEGAVAKPENGKQQSLFRKRGEKPGQPKA